MVKPAPNQELRHRWSKQLCQRSPPTEQPFDFFHPSTNQVIGEIRRAYHIERHNLQV